MRLAYQILLKYPPLTLLALSAPAVSFTGKKTLSYITPTWSIDDIIGECQGKFLKRGSNGPTTGRPAITSKILLTSALFQNVTL